MLRRLWNLKGETLAQGVFVSIGICRSERIIPGGGVIFEMTRTAVTAERVECPVISVGGTNQ